MLRSGVRLSKTRASVVARQLQPLSQRARHAARSREKQRDGNEYKKPYVIRPFVRDGHEAALQHVVNAGMYREELDIERARFPRMNRTLVVQTDGSMSEAEFEFAVPPLTVLFMDRQAAFKLRQQRLRNLGRLGRKALWKNPLAAAAPDVPMCNAVCFPYCVPSLTPVRRAALDELDARYGEEEAPAAAAADSDLDD
jgi:hypothetical protein